MAKTTKNPKVTNDQILEILAKQGELIDVLVKNQSGKSDKVTETTKKVEAKATEWQTVVESGKGKRISLAPQNSQYPSRMVTISRFAKSIGVPADQFEEFCADVEVALHKLKEQGIIPS